MDVARLIQASTAIAQTNVQMAATMKIMDTATETQVTGMELLLQGMDQFMDNLQAVASHLGQNIDMST